MKKDTRLQAWALLIPEIKQLIKEKNFKALKDVINEIHPTDLAEGFSNFELEEKLIVFRLLNSNRAVALFEDLEPQEQIFLIENMETNPLENLLTDMPVDEKTKLLKKLPERVKKKLLNLIKKEELIVVENNLKYNENIAGSVMNTYYISLSPTMSVKQSIEKIHSLSKFRKYSDMNTFYVIDNEGRLLGGISLRKLIAAPSDIKVSEIMSSVNFIKTKPDTPLEEVAKMFAKYDLIVSPVVDDNDRLIGIITVDDVIDIINTINTTQIYSVGKMSAEGGEEIKYANSTSFDLVRRRIGWLIFLAVVNFLSGSVLQTFESALATVVSLTFFIPMLLDTGGNAGSQTSVTIIRGLATGDVTFKNVWKIVKLELVASLIMALLVGFVAFFRAYLIGEGVLLAVVVGLSMVVVILLSISTGVALPLLSKKIGIDSAVFAGPIITTVADVIGLIVYFKIAQIILPQLRGLH